MVEAFSYGLVYGKFLVQPVIYLATAFQILDSNGRNETEFTYYPSMSEQNAWWRD